MEEKIIEKVVSITNIKKKQIVTTLNLLNEGNTVPFIARYRKEMTGSLDEDQIRVIAKEFEYYQKLELKKEEIIKKIAEKELLTEELEKQIKEADKLQTLEDIYLPFKEKKKTKATEAIKNGLEPLADYITALKEAPLKEASKYLNDNVQTPEVAIEGASYIIAEKISENMQYREYIRKQLWKRGELETSVKKNYKELDEKGKYEIYYDFKQNISKLPSYRVLAINRAEKEKVIGAKIKLEQEFIEEYLARKLYGNKNNDSTKIIDDVIKDSLKRLILPSLEREVRGVLTEEASTEAIKIFGNNLEKLIMKKPLKEKWILGLDPAFRTGCKYAVINTSSEMQEIGVIFPHQPVNKVKEAEEKIKEIIEKYPIAQIVIGNGTASRETEEFVDNMHLDIPYNLISEAGASVYSASKVAQEEFPDLTVEYRSAISIARRVQDPMAELVKIDPKSIGVGQYQHDVNQKNLSENLDFIMIKSINKVGIDLNTASKELLQYVSGLDKGLAKNIVEYRNEIGKYTDRKQLKKVKRLGEKAFTQAAGFLKINNGENYLDSTFVHPEDYKIAKDILKIHNYQKEKDNYVLSVEEIENIKKKFEISEDKINELIMYMNKPNLDIREEIETAQFDKKIRKIEDLKIGEIVPGEVRNIVQFGAFIDIGLKNDALVHISELSDKFVKNVEDILQLGDIKKFKIKEIDKEKGKIQLSLKEMS